MRNAVKAANTVTERSIKDEKTKIICVDDHKILLKSTFSNVKALLPTAEVAAFDNCSDAVSFAGESGCDILFTEIELYGRPEGIELARRIQKMNPRVNIIFTTVCSQTEYASEVMEIRPSAYLTKVVTKGDLHNSLQRLLYPIK